MSGRQAPFWQVSYTGPFEALKTWAAVLDAADDPCWLALSVFEENLPKGRLQLLFADEVMAYHFMKSCKPDPGFTMAGGALADENWIARSLEGLPVVQAGRFYVHGAHHETPNDAMLVSILIEAGEAFGTGHHGTTKGCLLAFEDRLGLDAPQSVLDLGTGAGTLAIAAAKVLPGAAILATDIDPIAIKVARENANTNAVAEQIELAVADGFHHNVLKNMQFDLIFANILANPLIELATDVVGATSPGGVVILSGILDHQAARVQAAYAAQGAIFIKEYALGEWRVLVMNRAG